MATLYLYIYVYQLGFVVLVPKSKLNHHVDLKDASRDDGREDAPAPVEDP